MAHELDIRAGKAAMAYVGARPWHGLGQELTAGASIDTWRKEAGMDYEILTSPVRYETSAGPRSVPGREVLFRSDTGEALGVVSNTYKLVQPGEVLEFFSSLAEDHGFELETAGVLFGGKKYWALARTPKEIKVGKKDVVRAHLMLATACDGSMSTVAKYVATRVVCQNTIAMALGESNSEGTVRVRHNTKFEADNVKSELGLFGDSWERTADIMKELGKRVMKTDEAVRFLVNVMGDPTKPTEEQPQMQNMATILKMFDSNNYLGHQYSSNTAWGLVNVVTEWVDHHRARDQSRRLDYGWFGGGMDIKTRALQVGAELVA